MDQGLLLVVHLRDEHFGADDVAGCDDHFTLFGHWVALQGCQLCLGHAACHDYDHLVFLLVVIHRVFGPLEALSLPPSELIL